MSKDTSPDTFEAAAKRALFAPASRFDYVAYDKDATLLQDDAKTKVREIELRIMNLAMRSCGFETTSQGVKFKLSDAPSDAQKSQFENCQRAIEKLEECYMWIGKAIRDDQIRRNGSAPLQEARKDG